MLNILEFAKQPFLEAPKPDGVYVDFTMGNGNDTLFFSRLAPQGHVYAFDIQQQALDSTGRLLEENNVQNATLIKDSHSSSEQYVPGMIDGGMFNLGYLPYSDKSVTTRTETTLDAVDAALRLLKPGGYLVIVVYPGHGEGKREGEALEAHLALINGKKTDVFEYRLINVPDAPFVFHIHKRG